MNILRGIDNFIKRYSNYFLSVIFLSYAIFFLFIHFFGILPLIDLIDVSFLEKITPDIFLIYVVPELHVYSYLYGLVVFYGVIVLIYSQFFSFYLFILRPYLDRDSLDILKLMKIVLNIKTILCLILIHIASFWSIYNLYFDTTPVNDMEELFAMVGGLSLLPGALMATNGVCFATVMYLKGDY